MSDEALLGIFGIGLLLGPALGGLVGWRLGLEAGAGVGAILIGLCGVTTALGFGWNGWQLLQTGAPFNPREAPWGGVIALRRNGDWQQPAICFIIALGFGLFGALARLLG